MLSREQKTEIIRLDSMGMKHQVIQELTGHSRGTAAKVLNDFQRVLAITDLHCGHKAGLTPPLYQTNEHQEEIYDWYSKRVKQLKPDILFVLGDCMDGKGKRSGGTELIEPTWKAQIKMARLCILEAECSNIHMVYGTGYHVGDDEDYEAILADQLKAVIKSHAWPEVNGITFDLKHKVGSSSVPHGRSTAIKRSTLWNRLWNDRLEAQPKSDVLLRGHVHYHEHTGNSTYLAMTLPALQGWGSKYGERQCEGIVDTGLVWFDIRDGDTVQTLKWYADIPEFQSHKAKSYNAIKK